MLPEGHLGLVPLQTLHGVSLPSQAGFQLWAELVGDATPRPAHCSNESKYNVFNLVIYSEPVEDNFLLEVMILFSQMPLKTLFQPNDCRAPGVI